MKNGMCINEKKTKEMLIQFEIKADKNSVPSITANGKIIERVNNFELLGVVISSDLSWQARVTYILQKVSKIIFVLITWPVLEFMSQILYRFISQLSALFLNMLAPCGTLVYLKHNQMKLNESNNVV